MARSAASIGPFAFVIGAVCWAASARASLAPAIDWEAPASCPDARALHERVTALRGSELALSALRVRGVIIETADELRLTLEVASSARRSSRVFVARDCSELFEAAALAIAIAIPEPAQAEPRPSEAAAGPTASPQAAPPIVDHDSPREAAGLGWSAEADAVLDFGALPEPAFGLSAGAAAHLGPWSVGVVGSFFPAQALRVASSTDVEFGLSAAELRGCRFLLQGVVSIQPCLGFELGRFSAWGLDLDSSRTVRNIWLAPAGSLEARAELAPSLWLALRGASLLPLGRKQYAINETDAVHAPDAVDFRLFAGLVVDMR